MDAEEIKTDHGEKERLELQAAGYTMLHFLDKVCSEQNPTYYLAYGTLLGAVRHKAIIPWDDDVDVLMPFQDFEKLADAWEELQDGDIVLQCHESDPNYQLDPMRLRMKDTYFPTQISLNCKWKEQGAWIDIYPFYPQKRKGAYGKFIWKASMIVNTIAYHRVYDKDTDYRTKSPIKLAAHKTLTVCSRVAPLTAWLSLRRKIRRLNVSKTGNNECLVHYGGYGYEKQCYDARWFDETTSLQLGDATYPVPKEWDKVLTQVYGDYMTPVVRPTALLDS